MKLRQQLILVSLLSLAIPWIGGEFMKELEYALRKSQQNSLLTAAQAVALLIEQQSDEFQQHSLSSAIQASSLSTLSPLSPQAQLSPREQISPREQSQPTDAFKALPCRARKQIDGFSDDWLELGYHRYAFHHHLDRDIADRRSFLQLCQSNEALYLLIQVDDDETILPSSLNALTPFDMVKAVMVDQHQRSSQYQFSTPAPGSFYPLRQGRRDRRIESAWQDTSSGYFIEMKVPLSLIQNGFGFITFDVDHDGEARYGSLLRKTACCGPPVRPPQPILFAQPSIDQYLRPFSAQGVRLVLVDRNGFIRSDSSTAKESPRASTDSHQSNAHPYLVKLYRWLLSEKASDQEADWLQEYGHQMHGVIVDDLLSGKAVNSWIPAFNIQHTRSYSRDFDGRNLDFGTAATPDRAEAHIIAAYPTQHNGIITGGVIAIQPRAAVLSLTNDATTRVLSLSIGSAVLIFVILMLFSSMLSLRIKRLSKAVDNSLNTPLAGRVSGGLQPIPTMRPLRSLGKLSTALCSLPILSWLFSRCSRSRSSTLQAPIKITAHRDEISDLISSFNRLIARINEYTLYLKTLSSSLSHELRTPLAIVDSSLENLAHLPLPDKAHQYIQRAQQGNQRQRYILNALSEANRLEESIDHYEKVSFNLQTFLEEIIAAYQTTYAPSIIQLRPYGEADEAEETSAREERDKQADESNLSAIEDKEDKEDKSDKLETTEQSDVNQASTPAQQSHYDVKGSPDLLAQMLDKLISNAIDFSPSDAPIQVTYAWMHNPVTAQRTHRSHRNHRLSGHPQQPLRWIAVRVTNEGPHIPSGSIENIFSSMVSYRKSQADPTEPNLGMGLYVAQLIVKAHQGRISANNTTNPEGVEFLIELPVYN